MTTADMTKPRMVKQETTPSNRYGLFSITFGVVFAVIYLFVMSKGWQLFTYYPTKGTWLLFNQPPIAGAKDAMKWYGYVATSGVVALVAGLIVCVIPEKILAKVWWSGLVWLVPLLAMVVVGYLVWTEG
jgi:hypothetical protein